MKKLLLLLLFICFGRANAQPCFNSAVNFTVAPSDAICSADFNGDGKIDIAVTTNGPLATAKDSVSVFLGTGTGNFGAASRFAAGARPSSICSADFNGDGKIDLAVTNYDTSNVLILLGTGTGSFGAPTRFHTGSLPVSIISADFNGDGKADIATVNENNNGSLSVLLGTGTLGSATSFSLGVWPWQVISADFNGDGNLDLATVCRSPSTSVSVFLGTGTGNFGAATNFAAGIFPMSPISICSADFNGDGKPDLATGNDSTNLVWVLLGTGTGSFGTAVSYAVDSIPWRIISADFNGDCKADLATVNSYYFTPTHNTLDVSILLGSGTGTFGTATYFAISDYFSHIIISADLNGDGKSDLITGGDTTISVLLNCGSAACGDVVNEINSNENIFVYPNPTSNQFIIETNTADKLTIDLYDVNGRRVFSKNVSAKTNIDVTTLNEGVYTLTIKTADRVINKKLVIVR